MSNYPQSQMAFSRLITNLRQKFTVYKPTLIKMFKSDLLCVGSICLFSLFFVFDLFNLEFSWMAFQERDFSRAVNFLMGQPLSHAGPEISGGGFVPGPGLTLIFTLPALIFKSPRGIHVLIQLSYLFSLVLIFLLVKKHFNRSIALLALLILISSRNFVLYSYAGWHTSLVIPFCVLILFIFDLYWTKKKWPLLFLTGFVVGVGIQIHFTFLLYYIVLVVLAFAFLRLEAIHIVLLSLLGILLSLSFYVYHDSLNNFENSRTIFLNQADQGNLLKDMLTRDWFNFLRVYRIYGYYFRSINGMFFFNLLVLAMVLWWPGKKDFRPYLKQFLFLICLAYVPIFLPGKNARFHMMAHPAFEIWLAISIYVCFQIIRKKHWMKISFIFLFSTVWVSSLYSEVLHSKKYGLFDLHTIYYRPFLKIQEITDLILTDLQLSPEEYENKFYLFRGEKIWPFHADYPLPSHSHYEMIFNAKYKDPQKNKSILGSPNQGVFIVENRHSKSVNLKNLPISKVKGFGRFTAYVYEGPYFYRQTKAYQEFFPDETKVKNWDGNSQEINRKEDSFQVGAFFEFKAKRKPFRFYHRLELRESKGEGLIGMTEIISADLRQSQFAQGSPYFLKSPLVELHFKDGTKEVVELTKDNFYNQTRGYGWDGLYEKYGGLNEAELIGALYIESPYGIRISFPSRELKNLDSISLVNYGYGSIESKLNDDSNEKSVATFKY